MNLTPEKRNLIVKWLIKIAAVCILLYLCLQNIAAISAALSRFLDLIMPLILGAAIAVILNVPMRFLEAHLWTKGDHPLLQRLRRPTAFLLSVLFIIGAFLGVILLVGAVTALVGFGEELFFRGYLMGVFTRYGRGRAVVSSALLFSLAHGVDMAFLPRVLIGALLGDAMARTGSILAPMLLHGCYNIAIILINFSGASGLFTGYSMLSYAVRLMGTALCWGAYARACRARATRVAAEIQIGRWKKKEIALLAAAVLATAAAVMTTGVMKP